LITTDKIRDVLSVDEFKGSLGSLTEAQWIKLGKTADYLCWGLAIQGQDILNLAFCKILEGKRKCPRDLPVVIFIRGVMESLVFAHLKKRKHDPLHINDLQSTSDTPEEILLAKQTIEEIDRAIEGNEVMVIMAQLDGYSPQQIQETVGLTPTQYASTLRAIRRKLDKLAIEGS